LNSTDPLGQAAFGSPQHWTWRTRPKVSNEQLGRYLKALYKPTDRSPGGTAEALRQEAATGEPTAGKFHDVKGVSIKNGLTNLLERGDLKKLSDVSTARVTLQDLSSSLDTWDQAAASGTFNDAVARGAGGLTQVRVNAATIRGTSTDISPFDNPADPAAYVGPETSWGTPEVSGSGGSGGGDPVDGDPLPLPPF
jgi:hypothetical protein